MNVSVIHLIPLIPLAALNATTANPFMWYVTRAAAVSSYIALTALVALGIFRSLKRSWGARATWWLDEAHEFIALLTAGLISLHLLALLFDPLIPFSLGNLLIPIAEPYRPLAVALGVLALYGMIAVLASSWLRGRIPHSLWRVIHYLSFIIFGLVTFHGLLAGSDAGQGWMTLIYVGAALSITILTLVRIFWTPNPQPDPRAMRYSGRRY